MGDFPNTSQLPLTIWTFSRYSMLIGNRGIEAASGAFTGVLWGTANLAIFVPFELPMAYPCKTLFWYNGTPQAGNCDMGIYNDDLTRMCSTGAVANSGPSTIQFATPTTDVILTPGNYYFALANSTTTASLMAQTSGSATHNREMGIFQQTLGALPLPAAATIAAAGQARIPIMGMTYQTGTPTF